MTPVKGRETGEQSLLSKLTKLRQNSPALSLGESGTLSSMLVDPSMVSAGDTQCTSMLDNWSTQAQSDESINTPAKRPHARTRGRIFYALSRLLEPLPGTRADSAQLIIGEQPPDTLKLDIATKQEWAALVLEAANDRSLTDVLTTFELMKVSSVRKYLFQVQVEF